MMFVELEGNTEQLAKAVGIRDVELPRGAHDVGGGRYRVVAHVRSKAALDALRALGLAARVTMDEHEYARRIAKTHEQMKPVYEAEHAERMRRKAEPDGEAYRDQREDAGPPDKKDDPGGKPRQ